MVERDFTNFCVNFVPHVHAANYKNRTAIKVIKHVKYYLNEIGVPLYPPFIWLDEQRWFSFKLNGLKKCATARN